MADGHTSKSAVCLTPAGVLAAGPAVNFAGANLAVAHLSLRPLAPEQICRYAGCVTPPQRQHHRPPAACAGDIAAVWTCLQRACSVHCRRSHAPLHSCLTILCLKRSTKCNLCQLTSWCLPPASVSVSGRSLPSGGCFADCEAPWAASMVFAALRLAGASCLEKSKARSATSSSICCALGRFVGSSCQHLHAGPSYATKPSQRCTCDAMPSFCGKQNPPAG